MKHSLVVFLCVFMLGIFSVDTAHAQLSRKERREWKKRRNNTEPADFKAIVEENNALKAQVSSLNSQLSSLQQRIADKDARITELQEVNTQLEADLAAARQSARNAQAEAARAMEEARQMMASNQNNTMDESGLWFKVQIGSFRQKDLSEYFEKYENFAGDIREDGTQSITLGRFRDYWDADKFKKYLREMGVEDAWIVPYKDGTRVPLKDVLEGVIN